jgi:hypothetical protein
MCLKEGWRSKMHIWRTLLCVLILTSAGCLPIELSVSPGGENVIIPREEGFFSFGLQNNRLQLLFSPPEGDPAFGLYAPNGKNIVVVSQVGSGMMRGVGFKLNMLRLTGKDVDMHPLFDVSNLTYLRWRPDSAMLSMTRVADSKAQPFEENLPELLIYDLQAKIRKKVDHNVSILHRWFPDSKSILAVKLREKNESDIYRAQLVQYDLPGENAQTNILAELICGKNMFFDLSPDGKRVLITALKAGDPGAILECPKGDSRRIPKTKLYELNLDTGNVTDMNRNARYAIYSPSGNRVLLGIIQDKAIELEVADRTFETFTVIDNHVVSDVGETLGVSTAVYPVWVDNNRILYLVNRPVYGTAGINLQLMESTADGTKQRNLQHLIDAGIPIAEE